MKTDFLRDVCTFCVFFPCFIHYTLLFKGKLARLICYFLFFNCNFIYGFEGFQIGGDVASRPFPLSIIFCSSIGYMYLIKTILLLSETSLFFPSILPKFGT